MDIRIAHVSDLHFGRIRMSKQYALFKSIINNNVDYIVITGDITEGGLQSEYQLYLDVYGKWIDGGRVVHVPGNHDRLGDCVAEKMMSPRVKHVSLNGVNLILIDSTGPQNWCLVTAHGDIGDHVLAEVNLLLGGLTGPTMILLHHHIIPLPTENVLEWLSDRFKWPFAKEIRLGHELLDICLGRADVVLHGHKHTPAEFVFASSSSRPLQICNAGCSPILKRYRIFEFSGGGYSLSQWHHI